MLSENLRLVPDWQYFKALNSLDFNLLHPDRLDLDGPIGLALINGCVAAVIQKQKEISKTWPNCQNFILNCLLLGDFLLLNFNFKMLLATVSTLVCLAMFAISAINGSEECLFGLCFGVRLLCSAYFAYWLCSYIYCKKKIDEITANLDRLFERQENLIERLSKLSQHEQK